jgi:hypothetical protein
MDFNKNYSTDTPGQSTYPLEVFGDSLGGKKIEIPDLGQNKYRGVGFLFNKNGYRFRGNMRKGRKCGYGQEILENGKILWGLWFNNKKNADFLTYYDSIVSIEVWRNDC